MTREEYQQKLAEADKAIEVAKASPVERVTTTTTPGNTATEWWTNKNAMTMSSVVLAFGILVILLAAVLIRKGTRSDDVLKIFGTIVIIVMSVFIVVAGYSDQQMAPAMGLLGTIAGYLLGKDSRPKPEA